MEEEVKTVLSCTKIMVENGMIDHVMVNWHTSVNLAIKLLNYVHDLHHQVNTLIYFTFRLHVYFPCCF